MNNSNIIRVPGTNYWVLEDDTNLTPSALIAGSIKLEIGLLRISELAHLPVWGTVVDVGAFIGDTALYFCERGYSVVCFEPQADAFECLRRNCPEAANYNAAAGNGEMVKCSYETDGGNLGTRRVEQSPEGLVTMRVDELQLEDVVLMKFDCEGSEVEAITGAAETIAKWKPLILCEVYDSMLAKRGRTRAELLSAITSLGYFWRVALGRLEDDRFDLVAWPAPRT